MNELQIFENEEFGEIRTVTINNEPWFVGKDVATALGYKNTKDAIISHVDDEDKRVIQRSEIATLENHIPEDVLPMNFVSAEIPNRGLTTINESGLYALIFGSKLETAKKFKHWVTSEVLPSLRKTGSYEMKNYSPEMKAILMHDEKIVKIDGRVTDLENNMVIDYGQQQTLKNEVNKVVVNALGGKESNAYKEVSKKVFSEINHDIQEKFTVNSRNNVPKKRFDEAIAFIRSWSPSQGTKWMIDGCNAQMSL